MPWPEDLPHDRLQLLTKGSCHTRQEPGHPEILFHDDRQHPEARGRVADYRGSLRNGQSGKAVHFLRPALANLRKSGCIQAGACTTSFNNCFLSCSDRRPFNCFSLAASTCFRPRCRNAWITNPLVRPAVAMFRGVVLFSSMVRFPSFTFRPCPSVRYTTLAGTCSDSRRRFVA